MDPVALMESAGVEVAPKVNAETVDKSNLSAGAILRYLGAERISGARTWMKYTFRIPNGGHFALGGDKQLNGLMARFKANDLVGLLYGGTRKTGEYDEHQWRAVLVTKSGPELVDLLKQYDTQYGALQQAVEISRKNRLAKRNEQAPDDGFGREFTDDEFQG